MTKKAYRISSKKYNKAVELLIYGNMNYSEIAQQVGISRNTLKRIREDAETQKIIRENADSNIKLAVSKASETLIDLLSARSEVVRFESAKHILALGGIQITDKLDMSLDLPTIISGADDLED